MAKYVTSLSTVFVVLLHRDLIYCITVMLSSYKFLTSYFLLPSTTEKVMH